MTPLRVDDLPRHLKSGLAPVYLIAGEEPLLIEEALSRLREAARAAGFSEREVLHADAGFEWSRLREAADNLSLFSDRRIVELRLPGGKPGQTGTRALQDYAQAPPADTLLLVVTDRLDARQRQAAWVSALAAKGAMLYAWPVRLGELPRWIDRRMRERGLTPDREATALLVERSEGNLLAAAQEIDKLALLVGEGAVDVETVREAVRDSARFDVFDLPEAALAGGVPRTVRICCGLREEGAEPTLVLWALARDVRMMADLQAAHARQERPDEVFRRHRVWRNRQAELWRTARATPAGGWDKLLIQAAAVDRAVKGAGPGRPWDELLHLAVDTARLADEQRRR